VVHFSGASAGHVCSAAFSHEKGVTSEQFVVKEQAYAVGRVPRRVKHPNYDRADFDNVAVNHADVFADMGQLVSNDLCAEARSDIFVAGNVIAVTMSIHDTFHLQAFVFSQYDYCVCVEAGVNDSRFFSDIVRNDVGEVVAAVFDLFEERRDSTSFAYVLVCGKLFHLHA